MPAFDYAPFEVVSVPFPFTDKARNKKRPALVLSKPSFNQQSGHLLLAMITSAKNSDWALDVAISDLKETGLPSPSIVRMKLFTLDQRFVLNRLGSLSKTDRKKVNVALLKLIALEP